MMRRINAHNVHYLVTSAGVDQIPWSVHSHLLGYESKAKATSPSSSSGAPEGEIDKVEPSGSAGFSGSEGSPSPDRAGGAVVYILSELHPEATTRSSSDALVLLHEIALGNH